MNLIKDSIVSRNEKKTAKEINMFVLMKCMQFLSEIKVCKIKSIPNDEMLNMAIRYTSLHKKIFYTLSLKNLVELIKEFDFFRVPNK